MHTPTKQQWQTVIDNFVRVLPLAKAKRHLDMTEPKVFCGGLHKCGTNHCVAGWYAVATIHKLDGSYVGFSDGANKMAQHLGFPGMIDLEEWAELNPQIWGNHFGTMLFYNERAFDYAQTLHDVITFLEKVKDRSPESNNSTMDDVRMC
jgi:hypothetical protein